MNKALEFVKKHPYGVAGGVIAVLVVFYLISRQSSSQQSGFASAIAAQQAGQQQTAQLNAQLSAQAQQTQSQLSLAEYQTAAQQQMSQDQLAAGLAGTIIPTAYQAQYAQEQLAQQSNYQSSLLPLEQQALALSSSAGHPREIQIGGEELALLLGAGQYSPSYVSSAAGLSPVYMPHGSTPTGGTLSVPGVFSAGFFG